MLHFARFNPRFNFTPYTSGRIFHADGELRWERHSSDVHLVYTGDKAYQPQLQLQDVKTETLDARILKERAYFLFGKRLDAQQRKRIGLPEQEQEGYADFAEVRIPRLLRYPQAPDLAGKERIQLVVCEYIDEVTEITVAYRFKELTPLQKQQEQNKL